MTTEYTDNFGLALPDFRMGPWHDLINTDIKKIDSLLATALSAANVTPWTNNTHYSGGMSVLDESDATIWMCTIAHTSAIAPTTFVQDRAAHPTYWTRLLTGFAPRGEWTHNTTYFPYDLVYQTNLGIFALCEQKHVSNPFGTIEDDAVYWAFLCDFSDIGTITAGAVAYSNVTSPTLPNTNVQAAIDTLENQTVALNNVNITQGNDIIALRGDMIAADNNKVSRLGDSMSGNLTIGLSTYPTLMLNKVTTTDNGAQILGARGGVNRWVVRLGDVDTEGAGNIGSSFGISRWANDGSFIETALQISRANGHVGIGTPAGLVKLEVGGDFKCGEIQTYGSSIELGVHRTSDGYSYIDLHSSVGSDFNARILRNPGINGDLSFALTGTGRWAFLNNAGGTVAWIDQAGNASFAGNVSSATPPPPSGRTLLATLVASGSANLVDTTSLTATYPTYEIVFENVIPTVSANQFQMRLYSGGTVQAVNYVASVNGGITNPASAIYLSGGGSNGVGSSGNNTGLNGSIRINRPSNTTSYKSFYGNTVSQTNTVYSMNNIAGQWGGGTGAITGVEFSMTNGSIASGEVRIYGII